MGAGAIRCLLLAQSRHAQDALTNVRFWPVTNRCLPIAIYEYTA